MNSNRTLDYRCFKTAWLTGYELRRGTYVLKWATKPKLTKDDDELSIKELLIIMKWTTVHAEVTSGPGLKNKTQNLSSQKR
eukprot:496673-Amorphochlora_amoeboformis.AAC.1